jgi:hypothetical protein
MPSKFYEAQDKGYIKILRRSSSSGGYGTSAQYYILDLELTEKGEKELALFALEEL